MKFFIRNKGQRIETINVAGVPKGKQGVIEYEDGDGRFYVIYDDYSTGVIREREDSYKFIYTEQKKIWNIKKLFLVLRKQNKKHYGNKAI